MADNQEIKEEKNDKASAENRDFNTKVQEKLNKFTKKCKEEYFTAENAAIVREKVKVCVHTISTGISTKITEIKNAQKKKAAEKAKKPEDKNL